MLPETRDLFQRSPLDQIRLSISNEITTPWYFNHDKDKGIGNSSFCASPLCYLAFAYKKLDMP